MKVGRDHLGHLLRWKWSLLATVLALAFLAQYVRVGGDWDWLVAMGGHIRGTGEIPDRVPFAAAPSEGWHNVPVLGELLASVLFDLDPRAAVITHLVVVGAAFVVLGAAARARGASDGFVAVAILLTVVSCFATLVVVRAQLWSLVLFPCLIALVCSQARRPDRRLWWAVPIVALWANLHGAALLGVCFLGAYLVAGRLRTRPVETVAVGLCSVLALGLTPQLWRTPIYYADVFDNVSAQRAEGLWSRPSLNEPIDVIMLLVIALLAGVFLRRRHEVWEYVAVLGLAVATASAARHGVWLVFTLLVLSTAPLVAQRSHRLRDGMRPAMAAALALAVAVAVPVVLRRGDLVLGATPDLVARVAEVSGDGVVLAPAPLSEALAVAGVRVWATNPLDAFEHSDQAAYLDFLTGRPGARRALEGSDVAVVPEASPAEDSVADDEDFAREPCGEGWVCYVRLK